MLALWWHACRSTFFAQNTNMRFITPCITYNEIQMLRAQQQQQQPEFVVQGPPHHYRALRSLVNPFGHPPLSNIGHGSGLALYICASGFWVLELIGVFRTDFWRSGSSSAFPEWVFCVVECAAAFSGHIVFLKRLLTKKYKNRSNWRDTASGAFPRVPGRQDACH